MDLQLCVFWRPFSIFLLDPAHQGCLGRFIGSLWFPFESFWTVLDTFWIQKWTYLHIYIHIYLYIDIHIYHCFLCCDGISSSPSYPTHGGYTDVQRSDMRMGYESKHCFLCCDGISSSPSYPTHGGYTDVQRSDMRMGYESKHCFLCCSLQY
jgi:hypothetical protein